MLLLILYVVLAMTVSFFCSLMEATLLSVSNSFIRSLENEGKKSAKILREFKENIDKPLAAVLTLNTIANTIGATGAGAQAQLVFKNAWITVFAVVFTFAILVFSEIIPKTLGAVYWRTLAPILVYPLKAFVFILYPFIVFARWITKFLTPKDSEVSPVSRHEITMMVEFGEDHGALSQWEEKVIKNILLLEKVQVQQIMTPRTVVFNFQKDMTVGEVMNNRRVLPFSRIPLYGKDKDDMVGMVLRPDILEAAAMDNMDIPLHSLMRPLEAIPESISVARAIEKFVSGKFHIFLVVDEYGGTAGIVTLEDSMESLLGTEIVDEMDTVEDMRELAARLWRHRKRRTGLEMEKKVNGISENMKEKKPL